jgi:hypothetical protein
MLAYVVMVLISSFLDNVGNRFHSNTRVALHSVIIGFIIFTTIFSYERVLPKSKPKEDQSRAAAAVIHRYKVAFPYLDLTLSRHLGAGKMLNTQLYFSTSIEGASREEAVFKAKEKALSNEPGSIIPFNPSHKGTQVDIRLSSEQTVVEEVLSTQKSS